MDLVSVRGQQLGEGRGGVFVVVDDENSLLATRSGGRGAARGCALDPSRERQAHAERAASTEARARRRDRAAVQLDEAPGQRQADAQSAFGLVERMRGLREQ